MKVGIMSMQRIANYGSFLQAYALKKLIEENGHQVEFVDYHIGSPIMNTNLRKKSMLIRKLEKGFETLRYKAPLSHKLAFIRYKSLFGKKYLSLLGISKERNYIPELDCLVIGSDEVFNCIQKNANVGYSLELFGKNRRTKKLISYAASFGNTTLDKLKKYGKDNEIAALLKDFNVISVRDRNSGYIVRSLINQEPEYHLDPVLIYDYLHCCPKIPHLQNSDRYLIIYAYAGRITEEESNWISDYAHRKELKVYAIGGIQKCADKFIDCSPFEVLAYFKNAQEIITDTFHGSIFSIITHRPFVSLVRKSIGDNYGNEEKITDLLRSVGLEQQIIYDIKNAETVIRNHIDYITIDRLLNTNKMRTKDFLTHQIG